MLLILFMIVIFIGVGLAIGYAVGLFGKKVNCSEGYVKVDNTCHLQTTTAQPTTTEPCDGCNCPMDIKLNPSGTKTVTIKSPRYPSKYSHNQDCRWNIEVLPIKVKVKFTQ